jgi:hypothetical protein
MWFLLASQRGGYALIGKVQLMRIDEMEGKIFRSRDGDEYGVIRAVFGPVPSDLQGQALAEDGCGNFFVLLKSGAVAFWDHESSETTLLVESLAHFVSALVFPEPVALREGQVKSVWIEPDFAKQFGLRGDGK